MQLDLRYMGQLGQRYTFKYNKIAKDLRPQFVKLIEQLGKDNAQNIDWWVSSPASRNNFKSPLFHYCCSIALLQELIRGKEPITEIKVDTKVFKIIIKDYLVKERIASKVKVVRLLVKQQLKLLISPVYFLLRDLFLFFVAHQTRSLRSPLPPDPLTLIDTFVLPGYIEEDRYYRVPMGTLSDKEKKRVWFVPFLIGFRLLQTLALIRLLRKSKRSFILKEDFLKLRDYLFAFSYFFRSRSLEVGRYVFQGVDISSLIREELISFQGVSSSFMALINYRFAKRLKEAGVKIRLVIDWFENQEIDRGWNAGFRRFFPGTLTKGYQGFVAIPHRLCVYPTEEEKKNAVIPHEIMVIGKGLVQSARKFCPDLHVTVVPAFRFQQVWQGRKFSPDSKEYTILVALPIMVNEAIHMLTTLFHEKAYLKKNCQVRIKPHPVSSPSMIKKCFPGDWPKGFELVSGDFKDCVEQANLLISSASSTCLETMAKGIPVIILGNMHGLTYTPIPEAITEDIWKLCYSPEDTVKAIQFYKNRGSDKIKQHEEVGRRLREEYFEPVTQKGTCDFLGLDYE